MGQTALPALRKIITGLSDSTRIIITQILRECQAKTNRFSFDFQKNFLVKFVHVAISNRIKHHILAIFSKLRYNSILEQLDHVDLHGCLTSGRFLLIFNKNCFHREQEVFRMCPMNSENSAKLVFLTRRAYETGQIRLLLRTDAVCDERDTGWQLLHGNETGLELANPENSLLVSVARALELEPRLASLLTAHTPPIKEAYAYDESTQTFLPTGFPEDPPTC